MKTKLTIAFALLIGLGILARCGSNAASTLTSATTGLKNAPDVTPSNLDSATGSSSITHRSLGRNMASDSRATLDIEVVSTPVTNGMEFTMKQCASDSQSHFVNMVATNESGKIKYVKTETLKSGFNGNMNITSTVYTDANGVPNGTRESSVRSSSPYDLYAVFSSDGTTNKFSATNGTSHVAAAWTTTLGCAKIGSAGTNVPFALSVSSTGERTCTASTDETQCSNLPTLQTSVPAYADYSGSQVYNCQAASGCTTVSPASAISLEDNGGTFCESLGGNKAYWNTASTTVSCGTTTTAAGVCSCLWPYYAAASRGIKNSSRSGECKIKGLVNTSAFDMGSDLTTSKNICIQNLSISR